MFRVEATAELGHSLSIYALIQSVIELKYLILALIWHEMSWCSNSISAL